MASNDFSWAMPLMRAGYAGRGLVYLVIAGFSLYAVWRGGQAQGTSSALGQLETTLGGGIVLFLIFVGMFAYAIWRVIDAFYDLEDYGSSGKGVVARIGMVVTGLIHLTIGVVAFSLLFAGGSGGSGSESGGGSTITRSVDAIMAWPGGRWIVGIIGLVVIGTGIFYLVKAWKEKYREELRASQFTTTWNPVLKAGVAAQGIVAAVVGGLFVYAALRANPDQAGGVGAVFSWLSGQIYGQVLVSALCLGLLGFAVFCFVNAGYRIIPKANDEDMETLAQRMKASAKAAT